MTILLLCCGSAVILATCTVSVVTGSFALPSHQSAGAPRAPRLVVATQPAKSGSISPSAKAISVLHPSADVSIGLSLAASIFAALIMALLSRNITGFLVMSGVMTGVHATSWLYIEGFRSSRSVGFRVAVFIAGFLLLWEVMQLLMTVMY